MAYRLWVRCVCEILGTMVAIYLAQANVANELLAHTKGHGMGFGWLSFGYGLAFLFGILLVGWVSAFFNPAVALAAWINGSGITTGGEFFAISGSTVLGAFLGGILVFLHFWPHFQIVPKPPKFFDTHSGRFLEQETDSSEHDPMEQPTYMDNTGGSFDDLQDLDDEADHPAPRLNPKSRALARTSGNGPLARTSIGGQQGGLRTYSGERPKGYSIDSASDAELRKVAAASKATKVAQKPMQTIPGHINRVSGGHPAAERGARFGGLNTTPDPHLGTLRDTFARAARPFRHVRRSLEAGMEETVLRGTIVTSERAGPGEPPEKVEAKVLERMEEGGTRQERAVAAVYAKAIKADQIAKLLCFCTRPAIYDPLRNWLCEFMSTIVLITTIFVFQTQLARVYPNTSPQYNIASAMFVGVLIILLVVGPGGPTGVAMSPARDMGPRLAHWVLPIKGKGSSEFLSYSWIPLTASLCGAVPAAFITRGINHMIASGAGGTGVLPAGG